MEGGRASRLWGGPAEKKSKQKRTRTGAAQRPSTDTRSLTNPGWHIRYLFPPSEEKLMLITPFLRRSACTRVISICEEHGGWSNDERSAYPFATSDLEVDRVPALREYLLKHRFMDDLQHLYQLAHGRRITAFDDMFVVRYQALGQTQLPRHTDAGDTSFMIALSDSDHDFKGGGTFFDVLGETVECAQGHLLTFDAKLFHQGIPITEGRRYLLVGFCFTTPEAAATPGNLTTRLSLIPDTST